MRLRTAAVPSAALALALAAPAAPALAHGTDEKVDKVVMKDVLVPMTTGGTAKNMEFVANLTYVDPVADPLAPALGGEDQAGSDIEFGRIGGRDYAFAGTLRKGMQIVDITNPTAPVRVAVYDCKISQGDVQIFRQGERVLATYTADGTFGTAGAASQCARDLGLTSSSSGTVLVDISNPAAPTTVGFAPVPRGSHNMTVHPSGRYLYNSNSDLITSTAPAITIFDIADPAAPRKVQDFRIPFVPTSLGSESHDITFSADGSRAYSAALSQTLVLDTSNPESPRILSQIVDPSIQLVHGSDPVTLTRADGTTRTLLAIADEQAGAATGTNCPGGGIHFYDVTGALELAPKKVGTWFIGETKPSAATCTAHVTRVHSEQGLLTVAWYDEGVRVLDLAGLADFQGSSTTVARGDGMGIREIGRYTFADANTWSFKTNAISSDGSFYGYGNDLGRGFDVYRFEGSALGRTVPALVPTELKPAPVADQPGRSDGRRSKTKLADALPVVPLDGPGSGPAGMAVLVAAVAGAALARTRRTA